MILDRIPRQFCEGPFWGNGVMGAVMYVREGKLCISVDHVGLWELRETLPDEPKASFTQILMHKKEFLEGNPRYVEKTDIFGEHIGRTRLPALAISLGLPGEITDFRSETDVYTADTKLTLSLDHERTIEGYVYVDSLVNILYLEFAGEVTQDEIKVEALGWDLESPRLKPLKDWDYEPCMLKNMNHCFSVRQHFGGESSAVLCGERRQKENRLTIAVGIEIGSISEEEKMEEKGTVFTASYLDKAAEYKKAHKADWDAYWSGFGMKVPNERLQEAFLQEMYKLYCNERETSMPVTLQGVWNPDNRMPAWFGDLHNDLNVQSCYWPAYKTGNVNLVRPYIEYYFKAMPRLEDRAWKLFGIKNAIHVPVMMAPNGYGAASEWCYWNSILGPELFVAVDFTWFYEYSREKDTLREKIYPFIEKVLHLYQGIAYDKGDEYLHIPFTQSPEVDRDGHMLMEDDSTFTLSCLHYLCRKMAEYARVLGKDGSGFLEWDRKFAPLKPDHKGYSLFDGIEVFDSHRHFCQMFPIYPLCEEAHNEVANASLDTAVNQGFLEYAAFSFPYIGIFAARCGRGNMCRTMLELYCMVFRSRNSFTVNGDPYRNGVIRISDSSAGESADAFTLESGFFVPTLLCEMFAHRAADTIWLMMGLPDEWKECSAFGITVEGGHRLNLESENYRLKKVKLFAKTEEKLTVRWKEGILLKHITRNGEEIITREKTFCCIYVYPGEEWVFTF